MSILFVLSIDVIYYNEYMVLHNCIRVMQIHQQQMCNIYIYIYIYIYKCGCMYLCMCSTLCTFIPIKEFIKAKIFYI